MNPNQTTPVDVDNPGCKIVVENNANNFFYYVLREQRGWFETEANFLVNIASRFQNFWDFSDDPGVFAIPVATCQSSTKGSTTAIRPDGVITDLIRLSCLENGLDNLFVTSAPDSQQFLPDLVRFSVDYNDGEGNKLLPWLEIIDDSSPLILVSLRNQQGEDLSAMPTLAEKGYQSYKLLPGFGLLVPYRFGEPMLASDVNLFFCKEDRAIELSETGLLCLATTSIDNIPSDHDCYWHPLFQDTPYAAPLLQAWIDNPVHGKWGGMYLTALNLYAEAKNQDYSAAQRYARVQVLQTIMHLLMQGEATVPRLFTGIRVMLDIGNREGAMQWSGLVINALQGMSGVLFDEPFLVPEDMWKSISIDSNEIDWATSVALITQEQSSRFSSWFTGEKSLSIWITCSAYPWISAMSDNMTSLIQTRLDSSALSNQAELTP